MDYRTLSLQGKGVTTREVVTTFKKICNADISPTLIFKMTESMMEQVVE